MLSDQMSTVARMFELIWAWLRHRTPRPGYASGVQTASREEQAALVALLRERPRGMKWAQLTDAVLEYGSAVRARATLLGDQGGLFTLPDHDAALRDAHQDVDAWERSGLAFWTILDDRYPARVRDIQEAPPFLFARGASVPNDVAVSVVGSRDASERGLAMATDIAAALVDMGVTVVAGLAAGIDAAAHRAALDRGGRTVAMIGTGINQIYPAAHHELHDRIAAEGLLLSQFWPDAPPRKQNFPMRNAVMSGYGITTVVVEAGEHSGARIQARLAVHHGRPVILTPLVVERTEWGKRLQHGPGVYLARSVADVVEIVDRLRQRPKQLREALSQIAV